VLGAIRPRHPRMDERLGLPHVQMPPRAVICVVLNQARCSTRWARQPARLMIHEDVRLLFRYVHVDADYVPWGTQLKKGG
jgi:hypothetical protein